MGDKDGYRSGPRDPPGEFGGEKGGSPADYQPDFRGSGGRPGFERGAGGFGGGAPPSSSFSPGNRPRPVDSDSPGTVDSDSPDTVDPALKQLCFTPMVTVLPPVLPSDPNVVSPFINCCHVPGFCRKL
ncbi:PREDICTED: uncharacterized protein LOC109176246 [Ipomoea nil]|uniref:uncharacterized protein LOC109176246 n=1 Tax=Ipomoea nil TaxID=35883 RepID=UPI000900C982|nr:PREDICTED: uncharacterized protein LOC109176246 [Ipomoea nil]